MSLRKGTVTRSFRAVPIGLKPVFIVLAVKRVPCRTCGTLKQVKTGFADWRRSYTRQLERYALELSRYITIQDVGAHLKVSWDVIKDIQKGNLEQIAVDEICIGHGQQYLIVVLDLRTGAVVFDGDGKGADALEPFWRRLKRCRAKPRAVAIGVSPAYIRAMRENLPGVAVVSITFILSKG